MTFLDLNYNLMTFLDLIYNLITFLDSIESQICFYLVLDQIFTVERKLPFRVINQ